MSTRVQKGGPVFRPVAKPRGRSTTGNSSRQSSVAGDIRSSATPGPSADAAIQSSRQSTNMPPPSIIPSTVRAVSRAPELHDRVTQKLYLATPHSSSNASSSDHSVINLPETPIRPHANPVAISTPSRIVRDPSGQSRSTPVLIARTPNQTTLGPTPSETFMFNPETSSNLSQVSVLDQGLAEAPQSQPELLAPPRTTVASQQIGFEPPSGTPKFFDGALAATTPRVALNMDIQVNVGPKRQSGRKKKGLVVEESTPAAEGELSSIKPRKKRVLKKVRENSGKLEGGGHPYEDTVRDNSDPFAEHVIPEVTKRKRRSSSVARKPRKKRATSQPTFDPDADPGEEIDPTVVTMASLCEDTGQGRISSRAIQIQTNHAAWKASNREKRARMRILMDAKKYGLKDGAEEHARAEPTAATTPTATLPEDPIAGPSTLPSHDSVRASSEAPEERDATGHGFDYSQAMLTSRFNVQVRIGANGETVIDEESLFVDRNDENDVETYTHVEESDTTKFVNSSTYGKKFRGSRWSAEETELFFDALSQFGENYELISYILPGRDRKACKSKFKAEDKKNPGRITHCLNNRTPYDIQTLSRMTGKDFTGPTPEIRAPPAPTLGETPADTIGSGIEAPIKRSRKKSRTPGFIDDGVEILGDTNSFQDDAPSGMVGGS